MASCNLNLFVDAIKINCEKSLRQNDNIELKSELQDTIQNFSYIDLKSCFFLLQDFKITEPFMKLVQKPKEILQQNLKDLFLNRKLGEATFIEILETLKKFQSLRSLGVCKHEPLGCPNNNYSFWRSMYLVCEELDDEEMEKIKSLFNITSPIKCTEELICFLMSTNVIEQSNLSKLSTAMESIGRTDVASRIISIQSSKKVYFMRNPSSENPCGLAIILNQEIFQENCSPGLPTLENRVGSHIDRDKLKILWENFGFKVEVYENLKSSEVLELFQDISSRDQMNYDAFVACILSHGDKDIIYGTDSVPVIFARLVDTVANHCTRLLYKPKLFFIQACQGKESQYGVCSHHTRNSCLSYLEDAGASLTCSMKRNHFLPEQVDVYQAIASIPGYVSYRSAEHGSIYVKELNKVLKEYGDKEDIDSCMKKVNENMSKNSILGFKQMPVTISTLRYDIIFKKREI